MISAENSTGSLASDTSNKTPSNAIKAKAPSKPQVYVKLGEHDVICGRGAPANTCLGNRTYRELVKQKKGDYTDTKNRQVKNQIAEEIVQIVSSQGGRFLRKIESAAEAEELGIPEGTSGWVEVPTEKAIRKTKQALRDKDVSASDGNARPYSYEGGGRDWVTSVNDSGGPKVLPKLSALFRQQQDAPAVHMHNKVQLSLPSRSLGHRLYSLGHNEGSQNLSPVVAPLLLSSSQSLQQEHSAGRFQALSELFPAMSQPQTSMNIISALIQRQPLLFDAQRAITSDTTAFARLLTNQSSQILTPSHFGRFSEIRETVQAAGLLHSPISGGNALQLTKAEQEIFLAPHKGCLGDELFAVSQNELHLLRVLAYRGIPVWQSDICMDELEGPSPMIYNRSFTWRDFASQYKRLLDQEHLVTQKAGLEDETQSLRDLAERVIMLLEKLVYSCKETVRSVGDNKCEPHIDEWFHAEICRWACLLNIIDDTQNRPVSVTAQDLVESNAQADTNVSLVGSLTKEACTSILTQAAHITRLRSIDLKNPNGLDDKLHRVYINRPSDTNRMAASVGQHQDAVNLDMIILKGILEIGFSGQLLDRLVPSVTTSVTQAHIESLIACLHSLQSKEDRQQILEQQKKRLFDRVSSRGSPLANPLFRYHELKRPRNSS